MRLRCRLRELRGERKLVEVADECGINKGTLSAIELGYRLPRDEWLPVMEEVYGAPSSEWWPGTFLPDEQAA